MIGDLDIDCCGPAKISPVELERREDAAKFRWYDWIKPLADWAVALVILTLAFPVLCAAWLLVKLTSRGPGIYTQVRLGLDGRPFPIFKLRTMYQNCEALTGAVWATRGDPRVTPVGRVLRRWHIDELPQLWNVLMGHMSMVGPRPERPEIVVTLDQSLEGYRGRLAVRPGVTGLAQIQLPPDSDIESVRAKLALDRCYVERHDASLDLRLVIGTAFYLCGFSYGAVRRLMALPTHSPVGVLVEAPAFGTI